ncbi:MAG: flagellin [Methanomicrobiales archaeon]|nr:flagellin [Methanomicrobiales archaeon]
MTGDDHAFTGLEAAIVFIALIVVASVFAYVVVGAGIATSQKNQEVMHAALKESGSAIRPGQTVIAKLKNPGLLDFIEFDLETATDLAAVDMEGMVYTIATRDTLVTFPPGDSSIKLTWRYRTDDNNILDAGEVATVRLTLLSIKIQPGETFTIGMTTAEGATASLTRTIPGGIGKNVYIELF